MAKCFINGVGCVSSQNTLNDDFLTEIIDYSGQAVIPALKANYKEFIPPAAIRRMSTGVKNSVVAANTAMQDAKIEELDAIITGTGLGCIQDSEKFLDNLIDYNEEYLTPTAFIQSTHNTVAGQIALGLKSNAYNFTYVHSGNSFQSALLDGLMHIQSEDSNNVLIGGVDEIGKTSLELYRMIDYWKKEGEETYDMFDSKTNGAAAGEASSFFLLSQNKTSDSYAELVNVKMKGTLDSNELPDFITGFLQENGLQLSDVDVFISGKDGDARHQTYYDEFDALASEKVVFYKHLFGGFFTVVSIAMWIAARVLKEQFVPKVLTRTEERKGEINNVLIYEQSRGKDHSLILLKNV